jgi:mitogen-activated protein kinase kinase 3
VKPANVLIHSSGRVKIGDMGLAIDLEKNTDKNSNQNQNMLAQSFIGTYTYMSPERIAGQPYSFASDIWGVGLTILAVCLGNENYHNPYHKLYIHNPYTKCNLNPRPTSLSAISLFPLSSS